MNAEFLALLKAVSRSFYLTIRLLPSRLREPVALAYLLARLSDTIADSATASSQTQLEALRRMGLALRDRGPMPDLAPFIADVPDPSERRLLERAEPLLVFFRNTEAEDRAEIVRVLETILSGQCLDIERFSGEAGSIRALATADELEDYTYRVAGCVGEFWTRICHRHLRGYASMELEPLVRLGISFGKGLQLVNILRDAPADLAQGRCYFPRCELFGGGPEALLADPLLARPLYDRWLARAWECMEDGLRYIEAVRPWRVRLACFLPWAIGVKTLRRMELERPLEVSRRVKISRAEVRTLVFLGALAAVGNRLLGLISHRVKSQKM